MRTISIEKRILTALLCLILCCSLLPAGAQAAGLVDLTKPVELSIVYQDGSAPMADVEFNIYLVAKVDETGELTPVAPFDDLNVDILGKNDEAWRTLASTLESYVIRDSIPATDKCKTNELGKATFPAETRGLFHGLYFVASTRHTLNNRIYKTEPFMVQLPGLDYSDNNWSYELSVAPKHSSEPVPEKDTISRKVLKVWMDKGHETDRPKEIEVQLFCDDVVYDTVKLNAANEWRHTWTGLEADHHWYVAEKAIDEKYTVKVEQEGITFVLTNTHKDYTPGATPPPSKPSGGKLPQTGQLWWPVPVLTAAGMLLIVVGLVRRREADYEE